MLYSRQSRQYRHNLRGYGMNNVWQLQKAKNSFSELVNEALMHGPQIITRHGEETAVLMSMVDYKKKTQGRKSLMSILRRFPKEIPLDLTRNKSNKSRDVDL